MSETIETIHPPPPETGNQPGRRFDRHQEAGPALSARWKFSKDNQTTSAKSVLAVGGGLLVNLLYELDADQLQAIAGILTSKLGLPVAVVSGAVAAFEYWRKDR